MTNMRKIKWTFGQLVRETSVALKASANANCDLSMREIIILISRFFQLNPNKIGNKLFLASFK